jgi:hypothetical protein
LVQEAGAPVKVPVTVLLPHLTVGWVIAVPAITLAARPVQVKLDVFAATTFNVPQAAPMLLPPQLALALMV